MKYYLYGKSYDSYKGMLQALKKYHGTQKTGWWSNDKVVDMPYQDFSKLYSHNDNDGTYTDGYWKDKRVSVGVNEEGRQIYEYVRDYYVEPTFEGKNLRVTDSYGRILNSKDLWRDMQSVEPGPERRYNYYSRWQPGSGTGNRSGNWRKYKGNHNLSMTMEKRDTEYHELEQALLIEAYGTAFKIRAKRSQIYPERWEQWERAYGGRRTKGWKRSRKEKQWM